MIRIVLTGAECTGKTTLAQSLAAHYGEVVSAEYAREYVEKVQRPLDALDVEAIAIGQIKNEDLAAARARRLALLDTNLLSTLIYAEHYYGLQDDWLDQHFSDRNYDLYFLCSPQSIAWEADPGQRDSPASREILQQKFRAALVRRELPFLELRGTQDMRFGQAVDHIDKRLAQR